MLGAHKLCRLVRRIATPTQAAITTSMELPAAGSLSAVPAAHYSLSRPEGGSFFTLRSGKYHGARPLGAAGPPPRMALFPCPARARGVLPPGRRGRGRQLIEKCRARGATAGQCGCRPRGGVGPADLIGGYTMGRRRKRALNLPRFRLHPYAALGAASSVCPASNSSGLRLPSAECIRTLL